MASKAAVRSGRMEDSPSLSSAHISSVSLSEGVSVLLTKVRDFVAINQLQDLVRILDKEGSLETGL